MRNLLLYHYILRLCNAGKNSFLVSFNERVYMKNVSIVVFSPFKNTFKVGKFLKKVFTKNEFNCNLIDLAGNSWKSILNYDYSCIENADLLIIGSPVYAWRIIEPLTKFIKNIPEKKGRNAAIFVTYGLITGKALLQLGTLLKNRGYRILAGLKVIARHSMIFNEAEDPSRGHPNRKDFKIAKKFSKILIESISKQD